MLGSTPISQLPGPVVFRAQADLEAGLSGFVDRAAGNLAHLLGDAHQDSMPGMWRQHRTELTRCRWVDQQVAGFFQRHPKGLGIEINGGLSTRFHRVSEALEWPRFSWQAINSNEVAHYIEGLFPPMDNHVNTGCADLRSGWFKPIDWSAGGPKLIIFDEAQQLASWKEFEEVVFAIHERFKKYGSPMNVLVSHKIADLEAKLGAWGKWVSTMPRYSEEPAPASQVSKIMRALSPWGIRRQSEIFIDQLVFHK